MHLSLLSIRSEYYLPKLAWLKMNGLGFRKRIVISSPPRPVLTVFKPEIFMS